MIEYGLNGALLGLFGCLILKTLNPASARIRLLVCLGVMLLIAVPWYWTGGWMKLSWDTSSNLQQPTQYIGQALQEYSGQTGASKQNAASAITWLLPILGAFGLFAFITIVLIQYRKVRLWRTIARPANRLTQKVGNNTQVWIIPDGKQAQATFFGRREIWIGEGLISHPKLDVALLHEATHHQLHHPKIAWLLTLFRCVYWWHPIVWLYAAAARRELELECDEHCANSLGIRAYQQSLAELLLDIKYVNLGSAFGGRKNFDIARIKKLLDQRVVSGKRKVITSLLFVASATGFVLVHAQSESQTEKTHQGWNVRMENVSAVKALEQIAGIGGLDLYLDPSLNLQRVNYEANKVTDWPILMDGVTSHLGVRWAARGGAIFIGSAVSVDDTSWLPKAIHLRGQGQGALAQQDTNGEHHKAAIRLDIVLEEVVSADDYTTSEMGILVMPNQQAAIRQGKIHISFKASSNEGLEQLSVALFKIKGDGAMQEVGSETIPLHYDKPEVFEWNGEDGLIYKLSIKPTLVSD